MKAYKKNLKKLLALAMMLAIVFGVVPSSIFASKDIATGDAQINGYFNGDQIPYTSLRSGQKIVIYTLYNGNYYAMSHFSDGRDNDKVYAAAIDVNGANVGSEYYGDDLVWDVTKVGDNFRFSYTENGNTYYLRSYGGLMVGADSDINEDGYRESDRYTWTISERNGNVRLRALYTNENSRYLRYSNNASAFRERDNDSYSGFYFALVSDHTPDTGHLNVHYVNEAGEELQVINGRDWEADYTTNPAYLIYDIEGYEYVRSTIDSMDGTEIRPILTWSAGAWRYTTSIVQSRTIDWSLLHSGQDVYVIYKEAEPPTNGGEPLVKESSSMAPPEEPSIYKESIPNNDGTNTIGLSITADTSPLEVVKLADVIVIFDTSTSMRRKMGSDTKTYYDNETPASEQEGENTRLYIAANSLNTLADLLIGDNTTFKDSHGNKLIRMSLVSFNRDAVIAQEFTEDPEEYKTTVNGLTTNAGTNWEAALKLANSKEIDIDPERATFIIFMTDGNPSYRISRGNMLDYEGYPGIISDGPDTKTALDVNVADSYYFYRVLEYFGALDENDVRNYNTAITQAKSIVDHEKLFFSIGVGHEDGVSRLRALTQTAYGDDELGKARTVIADEEDKLKEAFSDIAASIIAVLGWGDIQMTDGITDLANTVEKSGLVNVDGTFRYWKAPAPENWDEWPKNIRYGYILGTSKPDEISYPEGYETWSADELALYRSAFEQGRALSSDDFVSWDPSRENCNEAIYDEESGAVKWNMGQLFVPEAGATYKVTFRVWPSQEAYDILANLKNGIITYDDLTEAQKAQIVDHGNGNFSLRTNDKDPSTTYYSARKTNAGVSTTGDPRSIDFNVVDPMILVPEKMTVKKEWDYSINDSHAADALKFRVLVDGLYYQNDGSFAEGTENAMLLDITEAERTTEDGTIIASWTNSINIAPGIVIFDENGTAEVYETGHDYQLEETEITLNGEDASQYAGSYEFTTQTVRPMVLTDLAIDIHAQLTYLILAEEDDQIPEGADTYTIGDATYYVAEGNSSTLVGTNHRKAELDITKLIVNNTGMSEEALDKETFTYRVTLTVPADSDLSQMTAYEYVYRPGNPNTTLHGYQEEDDPISGDETRFQGPIFRWATVNLPGTTKLEEAFTQNEDGTKTVTLDISLLRNEVLRFTNLPTGTIYRIEEVYANYKDANTSKNEQAPPSYDVPSNLSEQGYTAAYKTKSIGEESELTQGRVIEGTITDPNARYYNQFTNTLDSSTSAELRFMKRTDGYTGDGTTRYYFALEAGSATYSDGEDPETGIAPLSERALQNQRPYTTVPEGAHTNDDGAYNTFGTIRYTRPGVYTYVVKEVNADGEALAGTTVDGIIYGEDETVTVTVEYVEGKLAVTGITGSGNRTAMTTNESTGIVTGTTTITNTHTQEETEATVKKIWDDENNIEGKRPSSLTVNLSAYTEEDVEGTEIVTSVSLDGFTTEVTLSDDNSWTRTITGLPKYSEGKEIVYKWTEDTAGLPKGYALTSTVVNGTITTLTNTYTPEKISVSVKKTWDDENDKDGIRPGSVQVQLLADGEPLGEVVTLDESKEWKYTWTELDEKKNGSVINYTVIEVKVPDHYEANITGNASKGYEITNKHIPETVNVTVKKIWDDNEDQDGLRPNDLVITLKADGKDLEPAKSVTLLASEQWAGKTISDLPKYSFTKNENGSITKTKISYSWEEGDLPFGYSLTDTQVSDGTAAEGKITTLTNSYPPKQVVVKVQKIWNDNEDSDGIRPDSVTVKLKGEVTPEGAAAPVDAIPAGIVRKAELNEDNDWSYSWTGLDMFHAKKLVEYSIEELQLQAPEGYENGYTPSYEIGEGVVIDGVLTYTIEVTNIHTPERIDFSFEKVGEAEGDDGEETALPLSGITFTLFEDAECTKPLARPEDGSLVYTAVSDAEGKVTFEKLPYGTYYMKETDLGDNDDLYWDNNTVYKVEAIAKTDTEDAHVVLSAVSGSALSDEEDEDGNIPVRTGMLTDDGEYGYTITNALVKYDISIIKLDEIDLFELEGAEFALYKASDMEVVTEGEVEEIRPKEGAAAVASIVTDENGKAKLGYLAQGTYYLLETKAPAGYFAIEEAMELEVAKGNITFRSDDVTPEGDIVNISLTVYDTPKYGDLRITKYLKSFELSEDATFIFLVEGKIDEEVVYSNVAVLTFSMDDPKGSLETILEHIPAGAEVVVTEVYTGARYELVSDPEQTVNIVANRTVSVEFTNDYSKEDIGGHGAANMFDPDDSENGWKWTRGSSTRSKDQPLPDADAQE